MPPVVYPVTLALDLSQTQARYAVLDAQGRAHSARDDGPLRGQGERAFAHIEAALKQAGVERDQLERLAVTTGPGSFTGIRVGLALMQGLALGRGLPLFARTSFDLYALAAPSPGPITVLIPGGRDEYHAQTFAGGQPMGPAFLGAAQDLPLALTLAGPGAADVARLRPPCQALALEPDLAALARWAARAPLAEANPTPLPTYGQEAAITWPKARGGA